MIKRSIRNKSAYEITDGRRIAHGFCQQWYTTAWQRMAGCGPTVVANIVYYLNVEQAGDKAPGPINRDAALSIMEDVWNYVKPTIKGIPEAGILYDGIVKYARAKSLDYRAGQLDIPPKPSDRPPFSAVISFVENALSDDEPVAFLNLNRGDEKLLDSWHWVTIIATEYDADKSAAFAEILDEGAIKRINLAKWYNTTSLGGGLVRFAFANTPTGQWIHESFSNCRGFFVEML
jgi:hypothetical protein